MAEIKSEFPTLKSTVVNPNGFKSKAFDIYLKTDGKEEEGKMSGDKMGTLVWQGSKKGPPRADKFPSVPVLTGILKKSLEK